MKPVSGLAPTGEAVTEGLEMRWTATRTTDFNMMEPEEGPYFGSSLYHQTKESIRIGFKNVNGFPDESQEVKYGTLQQECTEHGYGFDIQSFIKTNR